MPDQITIRQIEPGDKLTGISCGDQKYNALKIFLHRHARKYHERHLGRTYAAFLDAKVVGYITLVCGEVVVEDGDPGLIQEPEVNFTYGSYPAIKIARLLVDSRHRKREIGENLVALALGTAKDVICPAVGCRFVVVDSKKDAVSYYERQGFTLLDTPENRERSEPVMFIDLHKTPAS